MDVASPTLGFHQQISSVRSQKKMFEPSKKTPAEPVAMLTRRIRWKVNVRDGCTWHESGGNRTPALPLKKNPYYVGRVQG
jgi:hypothetical protein